MKALLAKTHIDVLEQFAASKVLLALDFDGTLAPIVERPAQACLRKRTQQLIAKVAKLYPVIVISGRSQADASKRLRGLGIREVIGNHGLEPHRRSEELSERVQQWVPALQAALCSLQGVWLEDKLFSLAVHYRQSRAKTRARAAILEAVAGLEGVRTVGGKQVVNLLPQGAPHKGLALQAARARLNCDTAIYVGDDETDEDVFLLDEPGRLLSIRVGAKKASNAPFYIRDQQQIDTLLSRLALYRAALALRARGGR